MRVREFLADLLFVLGAVAIVYGVALIFPPAGWIVGGLFAGSSGFAIGGWKR